MATLSITEMPKLKELLAPYGFNVHIHDACGGQSFSLEKISGESETPKNIIEEFFAAYRMKVHFYDELNFVAK